jgi:protein N-terminal methyltransferase
MSASSCESKLKSKSSSSSDAARSSNDEKRKEKYPFLGKGAKDIDLGECDKFWERVMKKKRGRLWYENGCEFWDNCEATVDAVLGGFGFVSRADAIDNVETLKEIMYKELEVDEMKKLNNKSCLDVGAGVGRVSETFLCEYFGVVDILEPVKHFVEKAKKDLGQKVRNYFQCGLEEFEFINDNNNKEGGGGEKMVYDVIWIQWCIGQLSDADFIKLLKRCEARDFVVVKENNCRSGFRFDDQDMSITRSDAYFRWIFEQAEYDIVEAKLSTCFPQELFEIRTYVLRRRARSL